MGGPIAHHACCAFTRMSGLGDDQYLRASPAIGIGQVKVLDGRNGGAPAANLRHVPFHGGPRMIESTECRHARPVGNGHRSLPRGRPSGAADRTIRRRWGRRDRPDWPRPVATGRSRGNCAPVRSLFTAGQPAQAGWAKAIRIAAAHRVINPLWPWFRQGNVRGRAWVSAKADALTQGTRVTTVDLRVPRNHLG